MTPERFRRIEKIYYAALARAESERMAYVASACAGDESLRRDVESLLDPSTLTGRFLEGPARAADARRLIEASDPSKRSTMLRSAVMSHAPAGDVPLLAPGQQFGSFRIERLLGRGGMGEVYEAEHVEHGRRVALKILTQRLSDDTDRARFLREGQLAAAVSHPHIVYIYGSEEIDGVPVIAMELLHGGTLKERVENAGPLPPVSAIDAILQVISGLEAAYTAGILHRDIKPSNCFVDADGTIKVGDFGLSVPTSARDITQLTMTGTFQGTPEYASPEQLRGKPLDLRADIYAVGATLYYLLTGQAPFEGRDLMALVSRAVTEPPTSPQELQPNIPTALVTVVLQCLAKDPADRPSSYRVLTNALEPLGSTVKTPAPLGMRFAAGVFDTFFSSFPLTSVMVVLGLARPSTGFSARPVVEHLIWVAYFAVTESVWGASLGKALCGFRVVTESGAPPRFPRSLFRALVFVLPGWFAYALVLWIAGVAYTEWPAGPMTVIGVQVAVIALLFVAARRVNGFAGIHEWATQTRTVLTSAVGVRGLRPARGPIEVPAAAGWAGPYRIVENCGSPPDGDVALGYDERLRRLVWLRFAAVDSDPTPHMRRVLRRAARPHWLAGQRTSGLAWDAYEYVPGQPFETLLTRVQSWETVRGWLCDLAEEVDAGLRDGSLHTLEFDRVWIGDDGRARLLDWAAPAFRPALVGSPLPKQAVELPEAERFLYRVAVSALDGHALIDTQPHVRTPQAPLPMPATDCLAKLREQQFTTSQEMLTALMSSARGPAAISRTKRAVHLSLCGIPTILLFTVGLLFALQQVRAGVESAQPHGLAIAAHSRGMSLTVTWGYLWLHALVGLMLAATLGLLSALATRDGIALRLMRIAVVTKNGARASGSRARLRAVLSWSPVLVASAAALAGHSPLFTRFPLAAPFFVIGLKGLPLIFFLNEPSMPFVRGAIVAVALAVFALAVMSAVIRPDRGLQDRLAGTWLVPR